MRRHCHHLPEHRRGRTPTLSTPARPDCLRDPHLYLTLVATILCALALHTLLPSGFAADIASNLISICLFVVAYPVVEEWLFRGVIHGELLRLRHFARTLSGISGANLVTSLLFVALHLINHPPAWAMAVLVPSLALGHFRERYQQVWLPMALHVLFNASYLVAGPPWT